MIRIVFRNLQESELTKAITLERLHSALEKFPDLNSHRITVTLSMENSPFQAGPDHFKVKVLIEGRKYGSIVLEKSAVNFYAALADVVHHTLERLNRCGDRKRVKARRQERQIQQRFARGS